MKIPTRLTNALSALALTASLTACSVASAATIAPTSVVSSSPATTATTTTTASTTSVTSGEATQLWADNVTHHAEADDAEYEAAEAIDIVLSDGETTGGTGVQVDGSTVTITQPGTYVISGELTDGQVVVDSAAEGKVRLVLDGATITNADGAALYVKAADEAVIVLADGSTNALTDGATVATVEGVDEADQPTAALFSMADLTITGGGALTVTGNTADGIATKDGLVIASGTVTVAAADDGIRGKDYIVVSGGTLDVTAAADALKATNEDDDTVGYILIEGGAVTVDAGDDGLHAEGDLAINDGTVTVARSNEGIEGYSVSIAGGNVAVISSDDGINVSDGSSTSGDGGMGGMSDTGQYLLISGGTTVVNADGDGLDSNGATIVSGGVTIVNGPEGNGNGALDANGGTSVTGGTLLAAGSGGMAEAPSEASTVGWVSVSLTTPLQDGETLSVVSGDTVIASYTATGSVASIILAADGIESGANYDVYVGGSLAGDGAVANYSPGGSVDGATKVATVTAGQHTGGMRGPGGGGFGRRP